MITSRTRRSIYCIVSSLLTMKKIGSKKLNTVAQCNVLTKYVVDFLGGKVGNVRWRKESRRDQIEVKNNEHEIIYMVIDENLKPILGSKTCRKLRLVMRVDYIRMEEDYDDLSSGLGRVKNFTYDNNSELLMPATINDVPRKLEAFRKRVTEILRRPTDSTVTGFCWWKSGKKNGIQEL
jgi:hypothetical protein